MPKPANKPIIAVDIDEVLFPLISDLIGYVDREHSVKLSPEEFVTYRLEDIWHGGPVEGLAVYESYEKQMNLGVAPLEGAAEALKTLSDLFYVIVMTSRTQEIDKKTRDWLDRHFPEIFNEVHILGNRKQSISWRPKGEVCKEVGVSHFIDDSLAHALDVSSYGIDTLLFGDYSWNQADELPEGVTRVKNWQEVLEYFDVRD